MRLPAAFLLHVLVGLEPERLFLLRVHAHAMLAARLGIDELVGRHEFEEHEAQGENDGQDGDVAAFHGCKE